MKGMQNKESKVLRELSSILNVSQQDIPRTLSRFKKGIEEFESRR